MEENKELRTLVCCIGRLENRYIREFVEYNNMSFTYDQRKVLKAEQRLLKSFSFLRTYLNTIIIICDIGF